MTKGQNWLKENRPRFVVRDGQVWDKLKTRTVYIGTTEVTLATAARLLNEHYENRLGRKQKGA